MLLWFYIPRPFCAPITLGFRDCTGIVRIASILDTRAVSYVYRGEEVRSVYCCMIGDGNWIRSIERIGGGHLVGKGGQCGKEG